MKVLQIGILALFTVFGAYGQCDSEISLSIIRQIESSNNPKAYNLAGPGSWDDSYGLYQITQTCLDAFNKRVGTTFVIDDLYDPKINRRVAWWYLYREIPRLLRSHGLPVNNRNKIVAYNAGIRYLLKDREIPQSTLRYIKKYEDLCAARAK